MTYLDFAATAPLTEAAEEAWLRTARQLRENPGNASALHSGGRRAKRLLEDAREIVAESLGATRTQVVFTSGATESNALAVLGGARQARTNDRNTIVSSRVEHDSIAKQQEIALREDFAWHELHVDSQGVSVLEDPHPSWALQTLSLVCAETGVIQPVEEMARQARASGVVSHTDAAQAVGSVPVDFSDLAVDLLSVGGHKVGAPVGIGLLLVRGGVNLDTDRPGGGHERKLRSGSVDVAGAQALAVAVEQATSTLDVRRSHYAKLRERLLNGLGQSAQVTSAAATSPSIVHLTLPTMHPEILLMVMDQHNVAVSAGSACHAGVVRPSQVLIDMGRAPESALGVLRLSFGPSTTTEDIDKFVHVLPEALAAAQKLD